MPLISSGRELGFCPAAFAARRFVRHPLPKASEPFNEFQMNLGESGCFGGSSVPAGCRKISPQREGRELGQNLNQNLAGLAASSQPLNPHAPAN